MFLVSDLRFVKRFIALTVYTRINYKIFPVTRLNKYLHYGAMELTNMYINRQWVIMNKNVATSGKLIKAVYASYGYVYIQGAYKLSEDFAKPYVHKYWTEIHDVTTIWKRNVCSFIVTLNAFDVRPACDTADVQAILPLPPNGGNESIAWTSGVSHAGRTSNAFKVTMKLRTFLFPLHIAPRSSLTNFSIGCVLLPLSLVLWLPKWGARTITGRRN